MKIRQGFVSNSSSSSFIVAASGDARVEIAVKIDLAKYADHKVRTVQELDAAIIAEYGYKQNTIEDVLEDYGESLREDYKQARAAVEAGRVVLIGSVSNDGDSYEELLYNQGFPETPGIEVITGKR